MSACEEAPCVPFVLPEETKEQWLSRAAGLGNTWIAIACALLGILADG